MASPFQKFLLSVVFSFLFLADTTSSTNIGVTYDPSYPDLPPPERVAGALHSMGVKIVRLLHPSPSAVRAFSYSNITLLLSVPNSFISSFARNHSAVLLWLNNNVLPFNPRSRISMISVGDDVIFSPKRLLISAMHNLRLALGELGITEISVSTTFSFFRITTMQFPPITVDFQRPRFKLFMDPFLDFLEEGNSSLLVNIYPYAVYRIRNEIPFNSSLFDLMVHSIVAALATSGYENIPLIVTETGWPSSVLNSYLGYTQATVANAELYLRGLTNHLKFGLRTPLKKEAMSEVYIYQLFDVGGSFKSVLQWGIMHHNNMTMKFSVDFSGSQSVFGNRGAQSVFWNRGAFLWGLGVFVIFLLLCSFRLIPWKAKEYVV